MADPKRPDETSTFENDTVEANHAIENGQGLGAREIAAQRDPGGVTTEDEEAELSDGRSAQPADEADENDAVQGLDNAG